MPQDRKVSLPYQASYIKYHDAYLERSPESVEFSVSNQASETKYREILGIDNKAALSATDSPASTFINSIH